MQLILASASPRRRDLLAQIGLTFTVEVPDFDEGAVTAPSPAALVEALSRGKAEQIAARHGPDALILAADTVVVLDGNILGKPRDEGDARAMLAALQGREHTVFTGVTLTGGGKTVTFHEAAAVRFRPLTGGEIAAYVRTGEPLDKAGAYGIQGFGATLVAGLRGDFYCVMGLPLCSLARELKGFGIDVLGAS
jgi:septum formation protein